MTKQISSALQYREQKMAYQILKTNEEEEIIIIIQFNSIQLQSEHVKKCRNDTQ
jgi:hypothetical protein